MHSAVSKNISIISTKYPTSITLSGPPEGYAGRKIELTGNMSPSLSVPLVVYLDGRPYMNITSRNGGFSFFIQPNETGELKIYVKFTGNSIHAGAVSNVVVLKILSPPSRTMRYAVIFLILALLAGSFLYTRKPRKKRMKPEEIKEERHITVGEERPVIRLPEDTKELYGFLRKMLGIPESLTPREALMLFRDSGIYGDMERITELHEKMVYGGIQLTEDEEAEFRERVRKVLEGYE